jgi:hypothetical protein
VVSWCVAKGVVNLFATRLRSRLADGNRALRARFPVPGADSASRSLRRGAPLFSLRLQGCRFASELAYHSHVAHSREPVLSRGPLCCALFGRDCKLTLDALTRSALTEIPSPPVSHRICSAEFRRLARSSEQVVALLRSCCLAQRSRGFATGHTRSKDNEEHVARGGCESRLASARVPEQVPFLDVLCSSDMRGIPP